MAVANHEARKSGHEVGRGLRPAAQLSTITHQPDCGSGRLASPRRSRHTGDVLSATHQVHPLAGQPAPAELLIDLDRLADDYYQRRPEPVDPERPAQLVCFGTSGHRGTPFNGTFTEAHILAITQAICDYRSRHGINGPLFLGKDTHAASAAAQRTALEVLAANGVETFIQRDDGFTPTPALSFAILDSNRGRQDGLADGVGLTPSHNPPADGGLKYNPPNGGPADTQVTNWIQHRTNVCV